MCSKDSCTLSTVIAKFFTLLAQWGKDTVFQEDYFDLLNAAETGILITYTPSNAEELLQNFDVCIVQQWSSTGIMYTHSLQICACTTILSL